jgi:hypothetical protein
MTVKSFASALALTAALCLPALATSATAAGKGKAETFNLQRTTNFNAGQTASTTAGKTRTVTSRKRTVTQTSSPAPRRASRKPFSQGARRERLDAFQGGRRMRARQACRFQLRWRL